MNLMGEHLPQIPIFLIIEFCKVEQSFTSLVCKDIEIRKSKVCGKCFSKVNLCINGIFRTIMTELLNRQKLLEMAKQRLLAFRYIRILVSIRVFRYIRIIVSIRVFDRFFYLWSFSNKTQHEFHVNYTQYIALKEILSWRVISNFLPIKIQNLHINQSTVFVYFF